MLKKTYNTLQSFHNFPAGSRQAARGTRICEKSLFCYGMQIIKLYMAAIYPESIV